MNSADTKKVKIHQNVMEMLVSEEIDKQMRHYPGALSQYINKIEVATYALNRLPPLYASCEEGLARQKERGLKEFSQQIVTSVRQGFAAVQRDPLRFSTPLIPEAEIELQDAKNVLQELADFMPQREVSWRNLGKVVKQLVRQASNRELTKQEIKELSYQMYTWSDDRYSR